MTNTLGTLRTALRAILNDSSGTPLWSDAALNQALSEAIAEHSYLFPHQMRVKYDVGEGTASAAPATTPGADLISVQRVELPAGTPLPEDPRPTDLPPGAVWRQAWTWRAGTVYLRNPASGNEVGSGKLVMEHLETWVLPDAVNVREWNGPVLDLTLLYLLAKRSAYQILAEWQAGAQGLTEPTITGTTTSVRINLPAILAALEVEIARAIKTRQARAVRSRTLDL